ncbi:hypothetical protein ACIQZO_15925 [Streptomyces sp. NPDC097617]|uniref:hypothetical protein n=1 Tax=Streptomyces sp. NPDC097617 TaxID=3366091 RepID=UPI00380B0C34
MTDSASHNDGEPTSLREKVKGWVEKGKGWAEEHPRTIHCVKAAGAVAGVIAVAVLAQSGRTEDEDEISSRAEASANAGDDSKSEGAESTDSAEESEKRNSPGKHNVAPHKRRLKGGREIDVSGYERGGSSEDEDEDEDPGEAAA